MIYVDSSIIIRFIEGQDSVRIPIEKRLRRFPSTDRILITSRLSCLECQCKPLREKQAVLLELYRAFFASTDLLLQEISAEIIDKATSIRAEIGLKTPDALHASTAIVSKAAEFWTTDKDFGRCTALNVQLFRAI